MAAGRQQQLQLPSLVPVIGPDGIAREAPVIAYTEKIIEQEQNHLKQYIRDNYSKIRDVERELENLTLELKLTAGPKKAALEHLRKKVELSTERIRIAKSKEDQARKVWEEATKVVKDEEAIKQKLCDDLNQLVQESTTTQFSRLEELKRRLEDLNPARPSCDVPDGKPVQQIESSSSVSNSASHQAATLAQLVQENPSNQSNASDKVAPPSQAQIPIVGDGRGRKKNLNLGRGKGNMNITEGRGSSTTGWTGAGFDVDGRV